MIDFTNLRITMAKQRVTQAQLAKKTSIRKPTIHQLCSENLPGYVALENLSKICQALNCSLSDIMEYIPDEEVSEMDAEG